jgi:hypothetical protein
MKTWRLKKKDYYDFALDLKSKLDELKRTDTDNIVNVIRSMGVTIYKNEKVETSLWIRFTIILFPIAFIVLFALLPINYIISGKWGYNIKWLKDWVDALGI